MLIDHKRYDRPALSNEQREFLQRLIPFTRLIQEFTFTKSRQLRIPTRLGLLSSIVAADIIVKSLWGSHEVAVKANNLSLLHVDDYWPGKIHTFEGSQYRSYDSWLDFSIDFSDEVTFQKRALYYEVLLGGNLDKQLDQIGNVCPEDPLYGGTLEEIIGRYGLWEFDYS